MAVYFVECNGKVKIGYSENPESRASGFQTGNPEEVTLVGYIEDFGRSEEKLLHSMLKEYHYRGEWYNYTDEVKKIIERMAKNDSGLPVEKIRFQEFVVCSYHYIDTGWGFFQDYDDAVSWEDSDPTGCFCFEIPVKESILKAFRECGWEGDGSLQIIFVPQFMIHAEGCGHGEPVYFVKQGNNGTSYLLMSESTHHRCVDDEFLERRKKFEIDCKLGFFDHTTKGAK